MWATARQLRKDMYANCEVLQERADDAGAFFRVRGESEDHSDSGLQRPCFSNQ
jgi:hypothetical protein